MPANKRAHIGKGDSHYRITSAGGHDIGPNMHYRDVHNLRGMNLSGVNLKNCIFEKCNLSDINFTDTCFIETQFIEGRYYHTRFIGADLHKAQFLGARAEEADFTEAYLVQAGTVSSNFIGAVFSGASMQNFDAKKSDFSRARFIGNADLEGATFTDVNFAGAIFHACNLSKATLIRCDLSGVDFSRCDTTGMDMTSCYNYRPNYHGGYAPDFGPPRRHDSGLYISGGVARLDPFGPPSYHPGPGGPPRREDFYPRDVWTGSDYTEIPYGRRGAPYPHPAHLVRKYRP